jgi:hypothetical protein
MLQLDQGTLARLLRMGSRIATLLGRDRKSRERRTA